MHHLKITQKFVIEFKCMNVKKQTEIFHPTDRSLSLWRMEHIRQHSNLGLEQHYF